MQKHNSFIPSSFYGLTQDEFIKKLAELTSQKLATLIRFIYLHCSSPRTNKDVHQNQFDIERIAPTDFNRDSKIIFLWQQVLDFILACSTREQKLVVAEELFEWIMMFEGKAMSNGQDASFTSEDVEKIFDALQRMVSLYQDNNQYPQSNIELLIQTRKFKEVGSSFLDHKNGFIERWLICNYLTSLFGKEFTTSTAVTSSVNKKAYLLKFIRDHQSKIKGDIYKDMCAACDHGI